MIFIKYNDVINIKEVKQMKISKERLCILQCRSGMTGAQVAAKAGLKPQSFSAVKNRGTCSAPTVAAIAAAFGVPVEEILESEV